jgi:hypothetical protein
MPYSNSVRFINNGEAVDADVTNRPIADLLGNTDYLKSWLQAMAAGSALISKDQAINSSLVVGQPVYYSTSSGKFEAAYFAADMGSSGSTVLSDSAQVWGILHSKSTDTVGDILLYGYTVLDISNAVDTLVSGEVPAGQWYLSSVGTGVLTRTRPMLAVPVVRTLPGNVVFVAPVFQDFDGKHRHYAFDLTMLPAGDVSPPSVGDPHEITLADDGLPGWLPADHAVFDGNAPAGAAFGYNLSQDATLRSLFPPVPLRSAVFIMQRPSAYDITAERPNYGQQLFEDTVVLDNNGIWWMTDSYDKVPWPTDYDSTSSISSSYSEGDPQGRLYYLKLYMTRLLFATNNAYVQSLVSLDDRLVVTCPDGTTAALTGQLAIDLDLTLMQGVTDKAGTLAIKEFDDETGQFNSGPVVEGIKSTSGNLVITGGSIISRDGSSYRTGLLSISAVSESSLELSSQLVRLDGVTEESFPVLYLGFPNDNTSSYMVKFEIPSFVPADMQFRFRPRLLGRAAGTLPQLLTQYYKSARPPAGLATPVTVSQSFTTITMVTVATVTANQAVEAVSNPITVQPGDVVYIKLTRSPADVSDAYNGEVGVMQQSGVLASV